MFNIKFGIERWKINKEYNIYVSTEGRIRDFNKKDIKPKVDKRGYLSIKIDNKFISIHRLVMMTWCPLKNYENMTVDHLNHNKRDNSVKNLEWVSEKENRKRANDDFVAENSDGQKSNKNNKTFIKLNKVKMSTEEARQIILFFVCAEKPDEEKKKVLRKINEKINQARSTNLPKSYFGFLIERV